MINERRYLEQDPSKKNADWANRLITDFRMTWTPLVNPVRAAKGMNTIMSVIDMSDVKSMFKDPAKMGNIFMPLVVMEKVRNILIGERTKAGLSCTVRSTDASSTAERDADKKQLENRGKTEELMSHLQQSIGLPAYKLSHEKELTGKSPYNGNMEKFDQLGLDANSEFDRGFFMNAWHQLFHEMDAHKIIQNVMQHNEVTENIDKWVNDILAKKAIAFQSYVNQMSGAITWNYLVPENVKRIAGSRTDGKDDICVGFEDKITVSQFLQRMGNAIDMQAEMPYILNAINYSNATAFKTVVPNTTITAAEQAAGKKVPIERSEGTICYENDFLSYKIQLGYIEWKSWDKMVKRLSVNYHGNLTEYARPIDYRPEDSEDYEVEAEYQQNTWKSYFLCTSSAYQRLYRFGKLYRQVIEGAEDEYSNYSICYKVEHGPTVAEISEPYIKLIQQLWAKFVWMIRKAKPKGRAYNYESLIQMANKMFTESDERVKINKLINMFEEGVNEMYIMPKIDGKSVGGNGVPNFDIPNGLDPTAVQFKDLIDWAVSKIKEDLAMTQLREAYNPKPNDGLQLQQEALESSQNATNYIGAMMDNIIKHGAVHTLLLAQDILTGNPESMAYKWLLRLLGEEVVQRIQELGKVALHRYAIYVNSFTMFERRDQVRKDTQTAYDAGLIPYDMKFLIDSVEDPRLAAFILANERIRQQRLKEQEAAQAQKNQLALNQQQSDLEFRNIQEKGKWENQGKKITADASIEVAKIMAQGRTDIKQMGIDAEPAHQADRADNEIRKETVKSNLKAQTAT